MPSSASPFKLLPAPAPSSSPCQVRRRPLPGWNRPVALPFLAFVGSVAAAAFPAGSTLLRPSRLNPPSLWLDRVSPSRSVAAVAFPAGSDIPLLFCRGRGHLDQRSRVRCCRPPWRGSLTSGRSKKQEGRPAGALFAVSPCRSLTLERRPLPKIRLLLRVFRPRPPRLRLPRHLGAIVFLEHTPVSTPAATFAPSRRCDCGGISTRRLLRSASTPVSSCVVPPLRLRGDVRLCVCECVWAGTTVGLPAH
jgi:hypothetical protein